MLCTRSAPAKAILVGEHAVVYGQPAIAAPLAQLRVFVDARVSAVPLKVHTSRVDRAPLVWTKDEVDSADPLQKIVTLCARYFGVSALHGELSICSHIPVASGLGSGAAVSAALARGVAALLGREFPDQDLNEIVYEVEKLHHGTPSGIDNTVIVYERPVYFAKGRAMEFLYIGSPLTLLVADSGVPSPTLSAVADVRERLKRRPGRTLDLFNRIGAIAAQARASIETGDHARLGRLMTENHTLLQALAVSSAALDRLVEAALRGGAYGAKLSGGGRGGNMIALASQESAESVKAALLREGAKRVIVSSVGGEAGQL